MDEKGPKDWKELCEWDYLFENENSNRNYFSLSVGLKVQMWIPYDKAQKWDNNEDGEKNELVKKIREGINQMQQVAK